VEPEGPVSLTETMVDLDAGRVTGTPAPATNAPRRPLVALELVLVLVLAGLGLAGYRPIFDRWESFSGPTYAALLASSVVSVVIRRRGIPVRIALALSAAAGALYLCYTVLVGTLSAGVIPGRDTLHELSYGLTHGWRVMLDESLPLANTTHALVWISAVAWLTGHITTEIVQRTRHAALPLFPPIVLFALSLPLTSATTSPSMPLVSALIGVALLALLVRSAPDPTAHRTAAGAATYGITEFHSRSVLSARLTLGLPIIVVCVLAAPLLADAIDNRAPFDPRDLRDDVITTERLPDPLAELKAQLATPRPAFQVVFPSDKDTLDVERVGIVSLDAYDGVHWTSTSRYKPAGPVLLAPSEDPAGRAIRQRYTIAELDDPWLPAAGDPERVDLRDVGYDRRTGDLLATGNLKGLTYDVVSRVVVPTADQLASALPDTGADAATYLNLPGGIPPTISTSASAATAGATSPAAMLTGLEQYLRQKFTYDELAASGQSYGRLERFLLTDRRGTAEQFATAFAIMARSLGFPTRVVVGYRVVENREGTPTPVQFVTSADYHAWAEVKFADLGWVAYDPTPNPGDSPQPPQQQPSSATTIVPNAGGSEQRAPREIGPSEGLPEEPDNGSGVVQPLIYAGGGIGGVLVILGAIAAVIVLLKHRRRQRRLRSASTADRVVGAWEEVVDRLIEVNFPMTPNMTALDVARASRATYGTATTLPLAFLVPEVGRAIYAADEPTPIMVTRAWQRTEEFEQNLASSLTRRRRWRARLSPRPLRR
jgi:transglutaminase-like putative cysteine protease